MSPIQQTNPESLGSLTDVSNLTADQLMFWVGQKLHPDIPLHNLPSLFTISRAIEPASFRAAFQTLVNSSDALRMVIEEVDDIPQYRIKPTEPYDIPYLDFSDEAEPEAVLQAWVADRAPRLFDIESSLFDTALIKLSPQKFVWYFNQYHITSDAISAFELPLHYLSELYGQALAGTLPERIDIPQFGDYIEQERAYRGSQQFRRAEAYWQQKLADLPSRPSFYRNTASKLDIRAERLVCELGPERSERLRQVAQQKGLHRSSLDASLFKIFAAVLITYAHRLGGDEKIVLGTPFHSRRTPAAKRMIGLLMQTLPLQVTIEADDTFVSLLNKLATDMSSALDHSPYAAPQIGHSYDLLLNYHVTKVPHFQGTPVSYEWIHLGYGQKSLLLQVHNFEQSGQFTLFFEPQSAVFTPEQRQQMPQHYLQLLDAFLADPHQSIHRANLLTAEEKEQLLVTWNDTSVPRQPTQCLHHLFEAQVKQTPTAVAVTSGPQQLTYQDLNQRANQLAHYLKKQGVGPETLVGICMERSLEMIVGLMGILKAGGGYVPLDPTYPKERLAFIAEDAQVSTLLTQSKLLGSLPPTEAQIIDLEADWGHVLQESPQNPSSAVKGDNVVYVMYTSGSTGKPKGVVVLHRGVCNYLLWRRSYFPLTATDRVLQKTSFSFVDSVWELFEPLMVGAQLIMAEPGRHYDPTYLVKFIAEQKITAADFIPSLLQLFLEEPNVAQCSALRRVTTGSETVTVDLQTQFFAKLKANLYNLYGPTEASIASTCWTCQPGDDKRSVPIGRPIANTQIYLLDKYLQPVPLGLPGEVHIGGLGLARGYLNRPELTAEKFISNPFRDDPEARLYKTGDLARYLADGNLEFLGRVDHQVKIRGYRIELGEVEAFLRQHNAVQKAAALVREDRPGDKRLVAYFVPEAKQEVEISQLRHYLKQKLPDYMVPSAFISLEALPLTPNGKVDRGALPAPDATRPELAETFVAPEGPVEKKLAEMWQQVLGLEQIGVYDNFFELGGHSLIAARLFSKIEREFGRQLPLATLFRAPTIAQISTLIEQKDQNSNWSSLVPIRASGTRPPLFFIHAHGGNVVGYYELAQYLGDDQPFYGLQAQGLNGSVNTEIRRFEDLATNYIKEIRQVQPQGPYYLGGWCYGGNLAFEMAQQLQAQGEEVALLAMVQSTPHSYPQYPPHVTPWQRAYYKAIRRMNLEIDWLAETKPNARTAHLMERGKRLTTIIRTRLEKRVRPLLAKFNINLSPSQASRFEELSDRHMSLWYRYEIKSYQGKATLFKAEKQPLGIIPDPTLGWGGIIKGELEIHEVPGHHLGILSEPRVQITAAKLKTALKKAQIS